jgi:cbb3-type cytochrome oxidase maturation protein
MNVLIWLIPVAIGLGALGLVGFLWTLKSGQFEDLDGAAHRILMDDDKPINEARPDQSLADGEGDGEKSL